jgi:hypothetical protein
VTAPTSAPLDLDRTWTYGQDVQHGGALLEQVTQVALAGVDHPHPLAVSAHFLAAAALGPATVERTVLRRGRGVSTVHARLVQGERTCLDMTVTAGRLGEPGVPAYSTGAPPRLAPVEECARSVVTGDHSRNGILEQLDLRMEPGAGWPSGPQTSTGVAEVKGWVRYASGREVDPLALLCLADALPPVTFALGMRGWVPTVELTVHVRALPAPGWLRLVQRAQLIADGWLDETCEIWDSSDRLVAQAVQLAGYRP